MANVLDQREEQAAPRPATSAASALVALLCGVALDGAGGYGELKDQLRKAARRDPIDTLLATVLGGGLAFYLAERDHNPRCSTLWDAVLYIATSLSVGYDDVFPKTEFGNALAAAVHTFGPSLAAAALDPPAGQGDGASEATSRELLDVQRAILARLDTIAEALQAAKPG